MSSWRSICSALATFAHIEIITSKQVLACDKRWRQAGSLRGKKLCASCGEKKEAASLSGWNKVIIQRKVFVLSNNGQKTLAGPSDRYMFVLVTRGNVCFVVIIKRPI